jgi:hypothetical protein
MTNERRVEPMSSPSDPSRSMGEGQSPHLSPLPQRERINLGQDTSVQGAITSHRDSPHDAGPSLTVEVFRYDPEESPNGRMVSYRVPRLEKITILDALVYIQRHLDRSLAFRYACRLGMCGTCTVMVNDVPRWACRTSIERLKVDTIRIAPLRLLPVIKDVLVDYEPFFAKYRAARASFAPKDERTEVAELEDELLELGNSTGFGAMGFLGNGGIMDVHIEIAYAHTGGMPIAIQHFCFAHRRMTARLANDNTVTYREDPQWFTPFYRQEGIE